MKRSEMVDAIKGDLARMDLDFLHGRNLDKIPYHARIEMLTQYFLMFAERYGMSPPPVTMHSGYEFADSLFWEDE